MTQPRLARQIQFGRFDKTRVYDIDGHSYPSVTSVIGMQDKPALVPWAAKMAAEYAVANREAIALLDDQDAVQLIKSNWRKMRDRAADFGTDVHKMIEEGTVPPPESDHFGYVVAADTMLREHDLVPVALEVTVVNPAAGYAGTVDVIATNEHGDTVYLDWKTGKGTYYDSHGMQLAALMEATHVAGPDGTVTEIPGEQRPTEGIAVRLHSTGYEAKGVRVHSDGYQALYMAYVGLIDVWQLKANRHRWDIT